MRIECVRGLYSLLKVDTRKYNYMYKLYIYEEFEYKHYLSYVYNAFYKFVPNSPIKKFKKLNRNEIKI